MALLGSEGSGGSVSNSAQNATSQSNSFTDGAAAREWSAKQAEIAFNRQKELMNMEMQFNREEAEKARNWNAEMANTVYTRSVDNMRAAGINPILAANMGLSGASVGSAQSASIGGAGAPMAQSFADSSSASSAQSSGESHGSSWNESRSGLATALEQMAGLIGGVINGLNAATQIDVNLNGLGDLIGDSKTRKDDTGASGVAKVAKGEQSVGNWLLQEAKSFLNPFNSPLFEDLKDRGKKAKEVSKNKG